jgi:hypothetical protein
MRFYNCDESDQRADKYRTIAVALTALLIMSLLLNFTVLALC